jgi:hypothetical protein
MYRWNITNRLAVKILLVVLILAQFVWGYCFFHRVYPGRPAEITNEIGRPYAVLTIDYGEKPKGFVKGEFYVLKVLQIRETSVDYGFCPIERKKDD